MLGNINADLVKQVADGLGTTAPKGAKGCPGAGSSPALSMANTIKGPQTRKVAIIVEKDFESAELDAVTAAVTAAGAIFDIVSCKLGPVSGAGKSKAEANQTYATTASLFYDAVYVPGGKHIDAVGSSAGAVSFLCEAYKHFKTVGLSGDASVLQAAMKLDAAQAKSKAKADAAAGVVLSDGGDMELFADDFVAALSAVRHFERSDAVKKA